MAPEQGIIGYQKTWTDEGKTGDDGAPKVGFIYREQISNVL
jgi:hypothetical protein